MSYANSLPETKQGRAKTGAESESQILSVVVPVYNSSMIVSIDVLLTWGTTRFAATRVCHEPRRDGVSGYSLRKLIAHALNTMTGFSVLPQQLASPIGFAFTAFGLLALAFVIGRYLIQEARYLGSHSWRRSSLFFPEDSCLRWAPSVKYLARIHFALWIGHHMQCTR
jgi:undecaprenyl-phosphate 4-deoxy-4-formamido-L-arabinose transferase